MGHRRGESVSWRIAVRHRTGYQYGAPARASYNEVRMTPATTGGQHLLTSRLEIPAQRIVVTPLGVDRAWFSAAAPTEALRTTLGLPPRYLLFVGAAQPRVNASEALAAVPGLTVQNRQNYAQDLQISSRGFGARSAFGVRGVRLVADGVPATAAVKATSVMVERG